MLKYLKSEDWVATIFGAIVLLLVILLPAVMKNYAYMSGIVALLAYIGYLFMGKKDNGRFLLSFVIVYLLAWLATYIAGLTPVKTMGLESVFFAVIIGLLIRNTVGLPAWMAPAVMNSSSRSRPRDSPIWRTNGLSRSMRIAHRHQIAASARAMGFGIAASACSTCSSLPARSRAILACVACTA